MTVQGNGGERLGRRHGGEHGARPAENERGTHASGKSATQALESPAERAALYLLRRGATRSGLFALATGSVAPTLLDRARRRSAVRAERETVDARGRSNNPSRPRRDDGRGAVTTSCGSALRVTD
jgi:hypothetical protein